MRVVWKHRTASRLKLRLNHLKGRCGQPVAALSTLGDHPMAYKDPEKRAAYFKAYREANREKRSAHLREWYAANKESVNAASKAYRDANKEALAAKRGAYRAANKERIDAHKKAWREANPEKSREQNRERGRRWREANPEKYRAAIALRNALKLNATPPWADLAAIEAIYEACPDDHHIDHISPLKGRHWRGKWELGDSLLWRLELPDGAEDIDGNPISTRVSNGLHVPLNLMPLPDEENLSKSNQAPQPGYMDWFGHSLVNGLHA
jgi:hypothetical protein